MWWKLLLFLPALLLAACGNSESNSKAAAPAAGAKPGKDEVALAESGRRFLGVEELALSASSSSRAYFGRTAFRPKALSVVSAPFARRITAGMVEAGQLLAGGGVRQTLQNTRHP